jgi:hypothetical protein
MRLPSTVSLPDDGFPAADIDVPLVVRMLRVIAILGLPLEISGPVIWRVLRSPRSVFHPDGTREEFAKGDPIDGEHLAFGENALRCIEGFLASQERTCPI